MAQSDKASDYESEDWGFKSLQGLLLFFLICNSMTYTRPWIRRWVHVPVAQWIAHQTSNLGVAGSNPVGYFASIAQLAEHLPRKQKVSSSNLDGGYTGRWSRGMILASGARGRGFDSRTAPRYIFL